MSAAEYVGTMCAGEFKSFSLQSGWGFLKCDYIPDVDIFVNYNSAPELRAIAAEIPDLQGVKATFELHDSKVKLGSYEAKNVTVAAEEMDVDIADDPDELIGQRLKGLVKSFNPTKGWGFLTCSKIPGDIFVSNNTSPELMLASTTIGRLDGHAVSFVLQQSKSTPGSYEANQVQFLSVTAATRAQYMAKGMAFAGGKSGKHGSGGRGGKANPAQLVGQQCMGTVKSFAAQTGWGFITCDSFSDDVFVSYNTSPQLKSFVELQKIDGKRVTFLLAQSSSNPGRYEAWNVVLADGGWGSWGFGNFFTAFQSAYARSKGKKGAAMPTSRSAIARPAGAITHWFHGNIKSFVIKHGYGFITSPDIDGDVFISYNSCPDMEALTDQFGEEVAGMPVEFQVQASRSTPGSFEATALQFGGAEAASVAVVPSRSGGGKRDGGKAGFVFTPGKAKKIKVS